MSTKSKGTSTSTTQCRGLTKSGTGFQHLEMHTCKYCGLLARTGDFLKNIETRIEDKKQDKAGKN